jgi:transglutaminase-like putative cysteine protease
MRFRLVHKLVSYLLVATAVATLVAPGVVPPLSLAMLAVAGVFSWFVEPEGRLGQALARLTWLFNLITLVMVAFAILQVARSFPEIDLTPFLNFVLFLLAYKLCQRRSNRDYLQLYILSFLIILAAAWQATSAAFMLGFALYVILATWTLLLFHLRREIEENYLVRHAEGASSERVTMGRVLNSRRVVGAPFFLTTGAVAVVVLAGAGLVFATVPRVGIGFLLGGMRRQTAVAGFSDQVKLGLHGVLSMDNQTVVLRAQVPRLTDLSPREREDQIASLYWRGTVYDTYDSGQWIRSQDELTRSHPTVFHLPDSARIHVARQGGNVRAAGLPALLRDTVAQRMEVVALAHPVAFALDQPVAYQMPAPPAGAFTAADFEPRWSDEMGLRVYRVADRRAVMADFAGARYVAYSRDLNGQTHEPGPPISATSIAPYLTPPRGTMSERVRDLALQLTRDQPTAGAKVQAVVDWLHSTHKYTVDLKRDERIADPLEDFLFNQTAGHCEYFASAAAVLLRFAGVPTRYVNGFLGGEWNDLRQAITIRENRAHSWVEAYTGAQGWVRVDATPTAPRSAHMSSLRAVFDSIELFWSSWIVEYSASQQLVLARRLSQRLDWFHPGRRTAPGPLLARKHFVGLGAIIVGLLAAYALRRAPQWRRGVAGGPRRRFDAPIFQLYRKTLDRLAARGWAKRPEETPHEFAARVRRDGLPAADFFDRLTEVYAAARYGETDVTPDLLLELRASAGIAGQW